MAEQNGSWDVRVRSIKVHATGIVRPAQPSDDPGPDPLVIEHFASHCRRLPRRAGVPKGDICPMALSAPPYSRYRSGYSDGEVFWIVKHGIKMTAGRPGPTTSTMEVCATVRCSSKLPRMSGE